MDKNTLRPSLSACSRKPSETLVPEWVSANHNIASELPGKYSATALPSCEALAKKMLRLLFLGLRGLTARREQTASPSP